MHTPRILHLVSVFSCCVLSFGQNAIHHVKPISICEVLTRPKDFDGKTVAIEAFADQNGYRRVLRAQAECGQALAEKPVWERELIIVLPSDPMLKTSDEPTRRLAELLNETMLHRSRHLVLRVAVIGVVRVAESDPSQPYGYKGFGLQGRWPFAIEVVKGWEVGY